MDTLWLDANCLPIVCQSAIIPRLVEEIQTVANRIPRLTKRAVDALKANGADTVH